MPETRNNDPVEVNATFLQQSELGIKIEDADGRTVWLPKQNVDLDALSLDELDEGDEITVTIPEWLASEKGLV